MTREWVGWPALGQRLRAALAHTQMSQLREARSIGVAGPAYWAYENSTVRPRRDRLAQRAAVVDLDVDEIHMLAGYQRPR